MPVPDTQVNFDAETIDLEDYDDLLAVENQIDKALVAIAPPPEGFPGKFLWHLNYYFSGAVCPSEWVSVFLQKKTS